MHVEAFEHVLDVLLLVDGDRSVGAVSANAHTQTPVKLSTVGHLILGGQLGLEPSFVSRATARHYDVIYVHSEYQDFTFNLRRRM